MKDWEETDKGLYKKFEFGDFKDAFAFMERVAEIAEGAQHHPDWRNSWNVVETWLTSHDAGISITDKDKRLAARIDNVVY